MFWKVVARWRYKISLFWFLYAFNFWFVLSNLDFFSLLWTPFYLLLLIYVNFCSFVSSIVRFCPFLSNLPPFVFVLFVHFRRLFPSISVLHCLNFDFNAIINISADVIVKIKTNKNYGHIARDLDQHSWRNRQLTDLLRSYQIFPHFFDFRQCKKIRVNARGLLMNFALAKISAKTPILDFLGKNFWYI